MSHAQPPTPIPTSTTTATPIITAYTPLESLLLFQSLRNSKSIDNASFNRISDELNHIHPITTDPSYDSGRLSPDALRELYLWLLKDEVKTDLETNLTADDATSKSNGDVGDSPNSRKRKAPSPSLPTVYEAAKHAHLLPQLVTRLYARYRENTIRKIREHEARYNTLKREVGDIEQGKWDDRLQQRNAAALAIKPSPTAATHSRPSSQPPVPVDNAPQNVVGPATASPVPSNSTANANNVVSQQPPRKYSQAKIDAIVNHAPEQPANRPSSAGSQHQQQHRRSSSTTTLPPLSEMAPNSPRFGLPSQVPPPQPQGSSHGYHHSPTNSQGSPFLPHHPGPPMQSPQMSNTAARPSSSPRMILPPPSGMKYTGPASQQAQQPHQQILQPGRAPPGQHPQQYASQQYGPLRQATAPSPTVERQTGSYPQPQSYFPQSPSQYIDRRTSYPSRHPQPIQGQGYPQTTTPPTQQRGYMMTPFHLGQQDANRPPQLQALPSNHSQYQQQSQLPLHQPPQATSQPIQQKPSQFPQYAPGYQQPSTPGPPLQQAQLPATAPGMRPALNRHLTGEVLQRLGTPTRPPLTPGGREIPLWKSERQLWPTDVPASPPRPIAEPLSPVMRKPKPLARRSLSPNVPEVRTRRGKRSTSVRVEDDASTTTRPGSAKNSVKDEPVATPAADTQDENERDLSTAPTSPSASRPMTRRRRGTLQSQRSTATTTTSLTSQKRKASSIAEPSSVLAVSSPASLPASFRTRSDKVSATRNFAKMSTVIMNEIQSHKHGSRFAVPVRDRDATGYSEIVKRPQDLKSIRSAITAGSRAVASLVSSAGTDTPGGTAEGGTVELERSEDIIPPKAIVNAVQLEKEVMRMFANAVMFNPGEDGMVADTREMFNDVESKIRDWRGVGNGGDANAGNEEPEDTIVDDTAVVTEDVGRSKRRKL